MHTWLDCTREHGPKSGTGTMYGISVRRERSFSLGGRQAQKKCHIILLYGDAAHLEIYPLIPVVATVEGDIAYTVSRELRNPGWIANRVRFLARRRYILARVAYERHFRALHGRQREVEFISG